MDTLVKNISEDIYQQLKQALELGRWDSGAQLTESQKSLSIQVLIGYENLYVKEQDRTAFIHRPEHEACDSAVDDSDVERPVKFRP